MPTNLQNVSLLSLVQEDALGNIHHCTCQIGLGGQGVVYRTQDPDLAIKFPLAEGKCVEDLQLNNRYRNVRLLPLPSGISICTPQVILRNQPGYVMKLLRDARSLDEILTAVVDGETNPACYAGCLRQVFERHSDYARKLYRFAGRGGAKWHLRILAHIAAILERLHLAGLVYGDLSPRNIFVDSSADTPIWMIDSDNLRLDSARYRAPCWTPPFTAPEILKAPDKNGSTLQTDLWSFSVIAFSVLMQSHPYDGALVKRLLEGVDWASDEMLTGQALYERVYRAEFPYVDDPIHCENSGAIPAEVMMTDSLRTCFRKTFIDGVEKPFARTTCMIWTRELIRASDRFVSCSSCRMSYDPTAFHACPWCDAPMPLYMVARSSLYGEIVFDLAGDKTEIAIPNRLVRAFRAKDFDQSHTKLLVNSGTRDVRPVPGFVMPQDVVFEFRGGAA